MRHVAAGEQRRRGAVVVPRDLEGVMALAERMRDLLEPTGNAVGLEEERAVAVVVGEQHLVGQPPHDRHAEHLGVEALGPRQIGDVHPEVIEPPDPHARQDTACGAAARVDLGRRLPVLVLRLTWSSRSAPGPRRPPGGPLRRDRSARAERRRRGSVAAVAEQERRVAGQARRAWRGSSRCRESACGRPRRPSSAARPGTVAAPTAPARARGRAAPCGSTGTRPGRRRSRRATRAWPASTRRGRRRGARSSGTPGSGPRRGRAARRTRRWDRRPGTPCTCRSDRPAASSGASTAVVSTIPMKK